MQVCTWRQQKKQNPIWKSALFQTESERCVLLSELLTSFVNSFILASTRGYPPFTSANKNLNRFDVQGPYDNHHTTLYNLFTHFPLKLSIPQFFAYMVGECISVYFHVLKLYMGSKWIFLGEWNTLSLML